MTIPLAKKVDGKKFMWDGGTYESPEAAQQVMEDYAKDGFEVQMVEEAGQYLVYSRRLATVHAAE
jgi:alpha-beta hydrolase superfamily lysophospholipase